MSNESFLTHQRRDRFDRRAAPVAAGRDRIPLLWLGLFSWRDARKSSREGAPVWRLVTDRDTALHRLPATSRLFEKALPGRGSLTPHVELLAVALRARDEPWLAMECDDLFLAEPDTFPFRFRRILYWLQNPHAESQAADQRRSALRDLTTVEKIRFVRMHVTAPIHTVRTALQDGNDDPITAIRLLTRTAHSMPRRPLPLAEESIAEALLQVTRLPEGPWHDPHTIDRNPDPDAYVRLAALIGGEYDQPVPWGEHSTWEPPQG